MDNSYVKNALFWEQLLSGDVPQVVRSLLNSFESLLFLAEICLVVDHIKESHLVAFDQKQDEIVEALPNDVCLMRLLNRNAEVQVRSQHVLNILKVALSSKSHGLDHEAAISEDDVAKNVLCDKNYHTESRADDDVSAALVDDILNVLQLLGEKVDFVGTCFLVYAPNLRVNVVVVG